MKIGIQTTNMFFKRKRLLSPDICLAKDIFPNIIECLRGSFQFFKAFQSEFQQQWTQKSSKRTRTVNGNRE